MPPGWSWDQGSLKQSIVAYMQKRGSFREVVEGPSELVLALNVRFGISTGGGGTLMQGALGALSEGYDFTLDGQLVAGERVGADSPMLGSYAASGGADPGLGFGSLDPTINRALSQALDTFFQRIEQDREVLLTKLGKGPIQTTVSRTQDAPAVPASDVDILQAVRVAPKANAYAILVGVEQYREKLPKADFAMRDAKIMAEYLTKMMGYQDKNVAVLLNERATKSDLEKYLEQWLPNRVEKNDSVFVYFSGHGAPNTKSREAYLVPYDGDPSFLEKTGYPVKRLQEHLAALPAQEVIVMLDSCFSGAGGRSVVGKGMRPMGLEVQQSLTVSGRTVLLAASAGDQVSSTYEEKGHGLLTYFFLKGLRGDADQNKDGTIELVELYDYVKPQVERVARRDFNNDQTPQLVTPPGLEAKKIRLVELSK